MIVRRDFMRGSAAALAASVGLGRAARGDMAPEPEKPKAWRGRVELGPVNLRHGECVLVGVGAAHGKRLRATGISLSFEGQKRNIYASSTLGGDYTLVGSQKDDLKQAWPVDVRYGMIPRVSSDGVIVAGVPYMMIPPDLAFSGQVRCLGQHSVTPAISFQIGFNPVRIDEAESFVVTLLTSTPMEVAGHIELEEIPSSKLVIDF